MWLISLRKEVLAMACDIVYYFEFGRAGTDWHGRPGRIRSIKQIMLVNSWLMTVIRVTIRRDLAGFFGFCVWIFYLSSMFGFAGILRKQLPYPRVASVCCHAFETIVTPCAMFTFCDQNVRTFVEMSGFLSGRSKFRFFSGLSKFIVTLIVMRTRDDCCRSVLRPGSETYIQDLFFSW